MAIKRILLSFCDADGLKPIADTAFILGRLFKAQVRGLFAQPIEGLSFLPDETVSVEQLMRAIEKASQERVENLRQARDAFEDCAKRFADVEADFASGDGAEGADLASTARLADISVLGSGARYAADGWGQVRDVALFGSGRPVLLAPPSAIDQSSFARVVIAWKDNIEAARAIAAAHPFLLLAEEVHVVTVGETDQSTAALEEIEQYLQLHHAEVRSNAIPASARNVGDTLLDRCEALGGALLVMGAYSHWRWRERVFGGVTEHVLRRARTPILMAH